MKVLAGLAKGEKEVGVVILFIKKKATGRVCSVLGEAQQKEEGGGTYEHPACRCLERGAGYLPESSEPR